MQERLLIDDVICVVTESTGVRIYDFDFRSCFPCRSPWQIPENIPAFSRCGAFRDYEEQYQQLVQQGITLVNTPKQHLRASELTAWYPLIEKLTPRSVVYSQRPSGSHVANEFTFPVFIKGSRQTSRHQASLAIARSEGEFDAIMLRYAEDPILNWQPVVVREYVRLRPVEDPQPGKLPAAFEFRTFWWKGNLVGAGRYWWEASRYAWNEKEREAGIRLAKLAAETVDVPFLVVDIGMRETGEWIVIECNDGQESGYAGVSPLGLWQSIIDCERR